MGFCFRSLPSKGECKGGDEKRVGLVLLDGEGVALETY